MFKNKESRENYLEAILVLEKEKGQVRSIDVANHLEFSKPSVSVAVSNLKNALLLTVSPEGWQVYERHRILTRMLIHLGVDETTAQDDACRIEHVISPTSFEKLKEYCIERGVLD